MIGLISYLLAIPLVLLLLVPASLLNAYVFQRLWGWFVVPLGMQPIGLCLAWGLELIATHLRPVKLPDENPNFAKTLKLIAMAYMTPLFGWLCGYIVHRLMVG